MEFSTSHVVAALASMMTHVWDILGTEIVIFAVTVMCSLILNSVSRKPEPGTHMSFSMVIPDGVIAKSSTQPKTRQTAATHSFNNCKSPDGGLPPWHIIDQVVDGIRDQGWRSCAQRALETYRGLQACGVSISEAATRSKHGPSQFYFAVVQSAIRVGQPELVESIIDDMVKQGIWRSLAFYESAMKLLAGQKHYRLALATYGRLVADGLEPSTVTRSCVINFAVEIGDLNGAITFFDELAEVETPPIRSYMSLLRVHAKRKDWTSSAKVIRDMQHRGAKLDSVALNVALSTGVCADQLEGMEDLVAEADHNRPPFSDIVSYNTLIKGYAQRGDADGAINVLGRLRRRGLLPTSITFNTTMDAAIRGQQRTKAWGVLQEMRDAGMRPDKITCSILVKGLTKSASPDNFKDTLALLSEVGPACGMMLRTTLYHVVLEAASQAGKREMMMQTFTQMQQINVVPSATAYKMLGMAMGQDSTVTNPGCQDPQVEAQSLLKLAKGHGRQLSSLKSTTC